jgi:SH3-like domain-containing protein
MRARFALAMVLGTIGLVSAARAAQVETRVRLLVREKPSSTARIVDRIGAGMKLPVLGYSADGTWAHVKTKGHEGWVPTAQVKAGKARDAEPAEAEEPAPAEEVKPLAKRRNVRPEAWVSNSRYHDEDNKLTVSANQAEIFGRPQVGSAVLGVLRRGEVVQLVRRSADKKWVQIDIGAGEMAWIQAKSVRSGGQMPTVDDPGAPERPAAEEAPPKRTRMAKATPPPETEPEPAEPTSKERDRARDSEAPPGVKARAEVAAPEEDRPPPRGRPARRVASRANEEATVSTHREETSIFTRPPDRAHGDNYLGIGARLGIALLGQRFTSNGTSPTLLTNYEYSLTALSVQAGLGYTRAIGQYFRLGIDGGYVFAGASGIRYRQADGSTALMSVQAQDFGGGIAPGFHFAAGGGIDLKLRLGVQGILNEIAPANQVASQSSKLAFAKDLVLGGTISLGLALPNLVYLAERPLGLYLYGGLLYPATRMQTGGLADDPKSSTIGGSAGGGLLYGLFRDTHKGQLALEASYGFSVALTHSFGTCQPTVAATMTTRRIGNCRDDTVTVADRGSSQHLIGLGLAYTY